MTQYSLPWSGTVTGDAGPYSDDDWSDMYRLLFTQDRVSQGVVRDLLNELEVSGVTSPIDIETGVAMVDGKFFVNDAATTLVVATPSGGHVRDDYVVLQKSWAAQTVRLAIHAGVEDAGLPALTQTDGTTWEIPIASVHITDAGVITVTDARDWVFSPLSLHWADKPIHVVEVMCYSFRDDETCVTGDGKGFVRIPAKLDGFNLVYAAMTHKTAGGGNATTLVQVHNLTQAVDMLTTRIMIDAGETDSKDAAVPYEIDTANDDVAEGDIIQFDFDQLDNTPTPVGALGTLGFQEP